GKKQEGSGWKEPGGERALTSAVRIHKAECGILYTMTNAFIAESQASFPPPPCQSQGITDPAPPCFILQV
ncbi:hypothetical protein LEMLEM_LOCUS27276, partial [Lemmus lemmus]